jgi:hypothetical protein
MQSGGSEARDTIDRLFTLERVRLVAGAGAAVVFVVVLWVRFSDPLTIPARPPAPRAMSKEDLRRMDYENPDIYKGYLEKDAAEYGAATITPEAMAAPFPYEKSEVAQHLVPGGPSADTGMLRLTAVAQKLEVRTRKGSARADHLVLRIENKTDKPVAFHVQTSVGKGTSEMCDAKAPLDQNAIALGPHGTTERTECFLRDNMVLDVSLVEAMQIPELSYFYVSRLYPQHVGVDERVAAGHHAPKGRLCQTVPQQAIMIGMQKGTVSWRDVVDFYARHRCDTYDFFVGYRAIERVGQYTLPATLSQVQGAPSP